MKSPRPIWSWALCKRMKRFSPSWVRTAVLICIRFHPFLLFLPFRDDLSPCWLPKCSKAGPASSTLKKTEITIWLRHWEYWEEWQQSWVPMGTRASNAPLLPAQLLFSSQNISAFAQSQAIMRMEFTIFWLLFFTSFWVKYCTRKRPFVVFIMHVQPGEKPN